MFLEDKGKTREEPRGFKGEKEAIGGHFHAFACELRRLLAMRISGKSRYLVLENSLTIYGRKARNFTQHPCLPPAKLNRNEILARVAKKGKLLEFKRLSADKYLHKVHDEISFSLRFSSET